MTFGLWLRLWLSGSAICEGGPFDGETRKRGYFRITVGRYGSESGWVFRAHGEPRGSDLGCYERDGVRFVWRDLSPSADAAAMRREKVERYLAVKRLIEEEVL
jgi:hypothetical protein